MVRRSIECKVELIEVPKFQANLSIDIVVLSALEATSIWRHNMLATVRISETLTNVNHDCDHEFVLLPEYPGVPDAVPTTELL